jgi:methylenetetrahydrofolate dehydrogenase (NADP+)/methenyltetrahydrofolate cyclohydrolase
MSSTTTVDTSLILDGKHVSQQHLARLKEQLAALPAEVPKPKLVVVLVGDDPASQVYVRRKTKVAHEIGMASELITLAKNTEQQTLLNTIERLNADSTVHGILVQLPLPKHIDTQAVLHAVSPSKDVDGFHPFNLGRLLAGENDQHMALPCTPAGMISILKHYNIPISGKHAVVIGRSTIVGKPIAQLLLQANATVTLCHSRTENLASHTQSADILIAAVGIPNMVTADMVKPGATVLDVGINRLDNGKLTGDVDYDNVQPIAGAITPVPGGVGPMTIATLMENTYKLYLTANK